MKDTLDIKTDEVSISGLCNSLNAWQPIVRRNDQRLADLLLKAQGTIWALYEELKELKGAMTNERND